MHKVKFENRNKSLESLAGAATRGMVAFFCCVLLVLAAAGGARAQAGRRVQKPKSDPPVPTPVEPATAPVRQETPEREKIPLLVTSNRTTMLRTAGNADDLLQGAVAQRLRDSKALNIELGGEMSRGEAHKRAKESVSGTHVVWLELQTNSMIFDPTGNRTRTQDLYIQYIVFEPKTGKTKGQGNIYLRPTGSSRIGGIGIGRSLPRCYPNTSYSLEFALIEAGIETAERIFREFSLPNPPMCS
ncbi:MAG TPA: hypothetical protein VK363_17805 [Pyrinomonadaceae bacterium]|nr:hypothetical protein [Pyrinomonadaceae bacterium]